MYSLPQGLELSPMQSACSHSRPCLPRKMYVPQGRYVHLALDQLTNVMGQGAWQGAW